MSVAPPTVNCVSCGYEWHSEAMADGLRLIGSCPRCNGELSFAAPAPTQIAANSAIAADSALQRAAALDSRTPGMVMGVPRGW
jgi:hypothetical protein